MKKLILCYLISVATVFANANAATITTGEPGYVISIEDLIVSSTESYDIEFFSGSAAEALDQGYLLTPDRAGSGVIAVSVANAIAAELNTYNASNDVAIIGTGNPFDGVTPDNQFAVLYETGEIELAKFGVFGFSWTGSINQVVTESSTYNWVTYGRVSSIPVPAAVWLFSSGLIGLIGIARRKNSSLIDK
jgi:hypothetical protein